MLIFLPALILTIFLHEAGHALAASMCGWSVRRFAVLPMRVDFRHAPDGSIHPHFGVFLALGQCLALPPDAPLPSLLSQSRWYFAGGILLGLFTTLLFGLLFSALPPGAAGKEFSLWAFWVGLILNLLSLLPDGQGSDGQCLTVLFGKPSRAEQFLATFFTSIQEGYEGGASARRPQWMQNLTTVIKPDAWAMHGANYAYFIALGDGRIDDARMALARLKFAARSLRPKDKMTLVEANIALEESFFLARHENDVEGAEAVLHDAESGKASAFALPYGAARTRAAIALASGKPAEAADALQPYMKMPDAQKRLLQNSFTGHAIARDMDAMVHESGAGA